MAGQLAASEIRHTLSLDGQPIPDVADTLVYKVEFGDGERYSSRFFLLAFRSERLFSRAETRASSAW